MSYVVYDLQLARYQKERLIENLDVYICFA